MDLSLFFINRRAIQTMIGPLQNTSPHIGTFLMGIKPAEHIFVRFHRFRLDLKTFLQVSALDCFHIYERRADPSQLKINI
ncbi:hypothetical protein ES708_31603 [subsurface metagenome]